jgi:hypothetical protein
VLGVSLLVALLVAGCGSGDDSSSSAPSPSSLSSSASTNADVCDAKDALVTDTKAMDNDHTVAEFRASVTAISTDLADLISSAGSAYQDEIAQFEASLKEFGNQLGSIGSGNSSPEAMGKAVGDLEDAADTLAASITCPS